MKIGVDYVSSQAIRGGAETEAKVIGKFDYVPKGGLAPQSIAKAPIAEAEAAIRKPDIKAVAKPSAEAETVIIEKPAPVPETMIGAKRK